MNVINTKQYEDEQHYVKVFNFDNTVQIDSVIEFVKQFENNETKMLLCECYSYDENDHRTYYRVRSTNELKSLYDNAVNPYFEFSIDFGNKETETYSFSLVTNINSKYLIYEIDKKKLSNNFNKTNRR